MVCLIWQIFIANYRIQRTDLVLAITKTLEKYEPRITNVNIKHKPAINKEYVLCLEIVAEMLQGEEVKFASYFMPNGDAYVL